MKERKIWKKIGFTEKMYKTLEDLAQESDTDVAEQLRRAIGTYTLIREIYQRDGEIYHVENGKHTKWTNVI